MTVRWMIACDASAAAAMAAAEPATRNPASDSDQRAIARRQVVLASAERVPECRSRRPPRLQQPATPAKKPRAARVTTCRCGDPEPITSAQAAGVSGPAPSYFAAATCGLAAISGRSPSPTNANAPQ